jgi:hypothetical protein
MDPAGPIKRQECEIRRWRDLDSSGYGRPSSFAEIIASDIGLRGRLRRHIFALHDGGGPGDKLDGKLIASSQRMAEEHTQGHLALRHAVSITANSTMFYTYHA